MYKKKMALVTVFAAGILGLAACGGQSSSSKNSSTTASSSAPSASSAGTSSSQPGSISSSSSVGATKVSLAVKGWQDNGDTVYTPAISGDSLTFTYDKSGASWAAAKFSMGTIATKLSSTMKLVMKAKITDHTGTGPWTVLPKFEFNDSAKNPAKECKFKVGATEVTYEWDLSAVQLTDALQMLLFVEPDCATTSGKLVFSEIYFTNEAMSASGVTVVGGSVFKTVNAYKSGDTFSVMDNFYDGGDYAYAITSSASAVKVDYTKWGQAYSYFGNVNSNVSTFKYINVTLTGTADKSLLMKTEATGSTHEEMIKMTGASQDYTFDFTKMTIVTGQIALNFFAEPGSAAVSTGTITFSKIEFSNTALVAPTVEVKNEITSLNAWDSSYPLTNFKEDGAGIITMGKDTSGKVTATWANQTGNGWNWFGTPISGKTERGIYTHVQMKLTSSVAGAVKGKVEFGSASAIEKDVTFTDAALTQTIDIDLSSYTVAQRGSINKAIVFPFGPDGHAASGTLTVESFLLTNPVVPTAVTNGYEAVGGVMVQTNQDVTYGTTTKVDYTAAKGGWEMAGFALDKTVDYSGIKTLRVHIDAVEGCSKIKFKLNDSQEYNIDDLSDLSNDFVLPITTAIDAASKSFVGMFINYGITGQAGSVTFSKIELSTQEGGTVINNKYTGMNAWDKSWAVTSWKDGGDSKFTVTTASGAVTAAWSGQALTQSWSSITAPLQGDFSFLTKLDINITASGATKFLVKVQGTDSTANVEKWVTTTASTLTQDIVVDLSAKTIAQRQTYTNIYIFPLAGDDGMQLAAGSLIINSAAFVNPMTPVAGTDTYDCLNGLYGPSSYSFTRGTAVKVDYTAAKGEWEAMGFALDSAVDYSTYTKLVVHVDAATAGIKLMFKVNDAQEYKIDDLSTLTNDFTFTLTAAIAASNKSFITCFVNYGVTGTAGSVTFSKLQLAK
jgi:hypothetical protein